MTKVGNLAVAMLAFLMFGAASQAAVITQTFSVTASGFSASLYGSPDPASAPIDPATLSFEISFDPTQAYTNDTTHISLISTNLPLASQLSFTNFLPTNTLYVGGAAGGATGVGFSSADFTLAFTYQALTDAITRNPSYVPTFGYSTTSSDRLYATHNVTGLDVTAVPEPSTFAGAMMGFALLGAVTVERRRRRSVPGCPLPRSESDAA